MIEIISVIFLVVGLAGIVFIITKKLPVLCELPEVTDSFFIQKAFRKTCKNIKELPVFQAPFYEKILEKILSKIKVLTLKIENKTSFYLTKLRKKSFKSKKKPQKEDNYWKDIKKATKK